MKTLIIIPARAGSKGLPGKNVKMLGGKPLVSHTFLFAKQICGLDDVICVTTNDDMVLSLARAHNMNVPFKRPEHLATDKVGSYDVIIHALNYYENSGQYFERVLLLQPTSPFRTVVDFEGLVAKYDEDCDMVVTVKKSKENPYFNLFEETEEYLQMSKPSDYKTRQDCPEVYAYNGSMYLIKTSALKRSNLAGFKKIKKLVMPEERSIDIDTIVDWIIAEYYMKELTN
jgi:CMP-N,N'-diacetyllegionaminic acid synthase